MAVHAYHDPGALESALALARVLWSAAESVGNSRTGRTSASDTATTMWMGPHKDTFVGLYDDEDQKSIATEAALRAEAAEWASFWQTCTNMRQDRLYNERVSRWHANHTYDPETGVTYSPGPAPSRPTDASLPSPPAYPPGNAAFY